MFVELALFGGLKFAHNRWKYRDIYYMKKEINKILEDNKLDFYTVMEVKRSLPWGYSIEISLNGKGFDKLEAATPLIETKLGYSTYIEQNNNLKTATIKVIVLPITEKTKFVPVKTRPFEVFCGLSYTMQELIVNLQKSPHILISGSTGTGKTELIRMIITNLIGNFTDRDINIFFSDLSDMCDFSIFENCKQVKGYAKDISESEKLFNYLMHLYTKRLEIFAKNGCKNIAEYNERFYKKRMPYTFVIMDEIADYYPVKTDKDVELKEKLYNMLRHFARKFRKVGFFLLIGVQRPDTSVLDPNLKANLCTKIGFSQTSDASSLVCCDTTELTNLENRKALLMWGNQRIYFKSLFINDKLIMEYIKSSIVKDRIKQEYYNKFLDKKEVSERSKEINEDNLPEAKVIKKNKKTNKKIAKISEVATTTEETSPSKNDKVIPYRVRVRNNAIKKG